MLRWKNVVWLCSRLKWLRMECDWWFSWKRWWTMGCIRAVYFLTTWRTVTFNRNSLQYGVTCLLHVPFKHWTHYFACQDFSVRHRVTTTCHSNLTFCKCRRFSALAICHKSTPQPGEGKKILERCTLQSIQIVQMVLMVADRWQRR